MAFLKAEQRFGGNRFASLIGGTGLLSACKWSQSKALFRIGTGLTVYWPQAHSRKHGSRLPR